MKRWLRQLKQENPMNITHYIGFDVHKKHINFCIKTSDGSIVQEGRLVAERSALREWAAGQTQAWHGAMEATLFSGWIYDTLKPYAARLEMAHPPMLKAIAASKKKNDTIDARKIGDLVRCNLLPACYVAPPQIRELRRLLRYRNLVVRESVRMQNKIAGLLMETGTPFNKEKLHGKKYFAQLLNTLEPEQHGNVSSHAETSSPRVAGPSRLVPASGTIGQHPGHWPDYRIDLSAGGRRPISLFVFRTGHELLWIDLGPEIVRRQTATGPHFQTAQRLAANRADRSRQTGAALESAAGSPAYPRTGTRTRQSCHIGTGPQTGGLFTGGGQKRSAVSTASTQQRNRCRAAESELKHSCSYDCEVVSDPPAVPRLPGDCAEEFTLPMLPSVCFEAGRFTLTQSSWTAPRDCSRKWMSGQAAALAAPKDRGPFAQTNPSTALRESLSAERPPSLLDFYLSWMSPGFMETPVNYGIFLCCVVARGKQVWEERLSRGGLRRTAKD
jgi:hypothetical protein